MKTLYANPLGDMLKSSPNVSKDDTVNTLNLAQIAIDRSTVDQTNTGHENDVKSLQGEAPGVNSGGDDETETDETTENQNFIGPILPRYSKTLNLLIDDEFQLDYQLQAIHGGPQTTTEG